MITSYIYIDSFCLLSYYVFFLFFFFFFQAEDGIRDDLVTGVQTCALPILIVGPIFGPTLGGWITDNLSWGWVFLINVLIGILSLILVSILVDEPEAVRRRSAEMRAGGLKIDIVGFALVALALGCLEVTLDRGQ